VVGMGPEGISSGGGDGDLLVGLVGRRPPSFPSVLRGGDFVVVVVVGAAGWGVWLFCREASCEVEVAF
jgi:hypothetical protein